MSELKSSLKQIVPRPMVAIYRRLRLLRLRKANRDRLVADVFADIYKNGEWGGQFGQFCSGSGSNEYHASRYADVIRAVIRDKKIRSVVDLGCGDFTVGAKLQMEGVRYTGVDIVCDLIRLNQEKFGSANVSFQCADIITEDLPAGDLCLIRQVLQHLSNAEILSILKNVRKYEYVIITEHYPAPFVRYLPNLDKPHGPDTRIYDNSAVYLDQPPFNVSNLATIFEDDAQSCLVNPGEKIRSFLITQVDGDGAGSSEG